MRKTTVAMVLAAGIVSGCAGYTGDSLGDSYGDSFGDSFAYSSDSLGGSGNSGVTSMSGTGLLFAVAAVVVVLLLGGNSNMSDYP